MGCLVPENQLNIFQDCKELRKHINYNNSFKKKHIYEDTNKQIAAISYFLHMEEKRLELKKNWKTQPCIYVHKLALYATKFVL